MDILTYALAKSYTDKALLGVGTIKGAPCTVKSQTEDDEYVYVTLGWENSLGTSEETIVKIKKGADGAPGEPGPAGDPGPRGISITKIEKIKTEGLIDTYQISFSDNTTFEYTISNGSTDYLNITNKPSIEGVELIGNKTFEDLNIASANALNATDENLQNLSNLIGDKTSLPAPTDTVVNNIASVDAKVDAIIDDNETGLAKTFSSDKITKTFATLEEANKRIPQYDVLPAPTEAFGGKVVQFIGTTTEDYIHNYFYECTQVENNYKWVNVAVQNVPTKVSELTNDSNFVTETELNAKGYLTEHQDLSAYATKEEIPTVPSKVSELTNDSNYQTAEQVNSTVTTEIAKIVADAPEDLNTLKEMSDWIAGHEDDASAMNSAISDNKTAITALQTGKADKSEIPTTVVELTDSADYAKKTDLHSHENKTVLDGITSTKISNWDSAKTHADSEHAPSTAQENVIETVKVNGTALTPSSKAVNIDLSDYAKKTDIPKSLPANGGNADTVNNHTVETNVPVDAVFTDTIYDDTEVKESIEELNSNLDVLQYSEVAGGKNKVFCVSYGYINSSGYYFIDYNSTSAICYLENGKTYKISCNIKPFADNIRIGKIYSKTPENGTVDNLQQLGKGIDTFTSNFTGYAIVYTHPIKNENVINSIQIEEGTTATPYEPYIPSVKMLADENAQQSTEAMDLKMLGWSVPSECPIQNYVDSNGVFHKRVGRVDLGSLNWNYISSGQFFYADLAGGKIGSENAYCRKYNLSNATAYGGMANKEFRLSLSSETVSRVYVKDTSYTDATTLKQATKGVYLYYELETPITKTIDGNEIGEMVSDVRKETTVNLLNPILQTTTQYGVTCTNNGDGTYTLNGTANGRCLILVGTISIPNNIGKTVKLLGTPKGGLNTTYHMECTDNKNNDSICKDISYGGIKEIQQWSSSNLWYVYIIIDQNVSLDNLVFKPMLTTNLNATYDDFVPYTGDTGKLNSDVAAIKKDIGNLTGDIDAKTVNGHTVESNVPADAKFTDTIYDDTSIQNKLTTHTHDNRYYTETEVNNLLNGKANSSHSHGAYELPIGSIFLSSRKVAPSYGNWEYLGTIQNLFSDLPLIQSIGEGYVYNRTS